MIFKLWLRGFSFKRESLRRPTFKRVFIVLIIVPLIILHISISRLCLVVDDLLYRAYKKEIIQNLLFVIGVPRSGTSFLLELIANDKSNFTAFQLWELVFAPSIIQKKLLLSFSVIMKRVHFPTKSFFNKIDELFFSKMKGIHDMNLERVEEDELVYLYLYKSAYLMFLFPELESFHQLVIPDNQKNLEERIKMQRFYESLVKRHLYVFNKGGERYFISKNPIHSIRLESLNIVFPTAKYLYIQRPLEKTIPSTISLNLNLYRFFCTVNAVNPLRKTTIQMLLEWDKYVKDYHQNKNWKPIEISFKEMVQLPSKQAKMIYTSLDLEINSSYKNYLKQQDAFSKHYKSKHQYLPLTVSELNIINRIK